MSTNRLEESPRSGVWSQTKTIIVASFAFITALAWNSAFQNLFDNNSFLKMGGPWVYAIAITLIGVGLTFLLKDKNGEETETKVPS